MKAAPQSSATSESPIKKTRAPAIAEALFLCISIMYNNHDFNYAQRANVYINPFFVTIRDVRSEDDNVH